MQQLIILIGLIVLTGCGLSKSSTERTAIEGLAGPSHKGKHFGKVITPRGAITVAQLESSMQHTDKLTGVKVTGVVDKVCPAKGCWMTLRNDKGDNLFVKFKDYAFFMPKDLMGSKVVIEGTCTWDITTVEELRHQAQEAGQSDEEIASITQPVRELFFMADGVVVVK